MKITIAVYALCTLLITAVLCSALLPAVAQAATTLRSGAQARAFSHEF
jgi:hypothetical protein